MKEGHKQVDTTQSTGDVEDRVASFATEIAGARLDTELSLVRQGINSIALIRLVARIEDEFEVELDLGEVLRTPTLKVISLAVSTQLKEGTAK